MSTGSSRAAGASAVKKHKFEIPSKRSFSNQLTCPLCNKTFAKFHGIALNAHVEACLLKSEEKSLMEMVGKSRVLMNNDDDECIVIEDDDDEEVVVSQKENDLAKDLAKAQEEEKERAAEFDRAHSNDLSNVNTIDDLSSTQKKPCPFYKMLSPTSFSMDAFCYGKIDNCSAYFLSHFHSDHYMGLSGKFDYGPIFCSPITAALIKSQLNVKEEFVHIIPLDTTVTIQGVSVRLVDANHCPGAVIFLFEIPTNANGTGETLKYIHTGDFRASSFFHWSNPLLLNKVWNKVYLDTSYCKPEHTFPDQHVVLRVIAELAGSVQKGESLPDIISSVNGIKQYFVAISNLVAGPPKKKKTLFVVGSYLIGKEKVFISIAKKIGAKVYTEKRKMKIYKLLAEHDPVLASLLTDKREEADVQVVTMNHINYEELMELKGTQYDQVIAFRPTGWTFTQGKASTSSSAFSLQSLKPVYLEDGITVIPVPYSEHSSFSELRQFCTNLKIKQIIPTVNLDPKSRREMEYLFKNWVI